MCLKRFNIATCPNCGHHFANIGHGLRECEQCGRIQGWPIPTAGKQGDQAADPDHIDRLEGYFGEMPYVL